MWGVKCENTYGLLGVYLAPPGSRCRLKPSNLEGCEVWKGVKCGRVEVCEVCHQAAEPALAVQLG